VPVSNVAFKVVCFVTLQENFFTECLWLRMVWNWFQKLKLRSLSQYNNELPHYWKLGMQPTND